MYFYISAASIPGFHIRPGFVFTALIPPNRKHIEVRWCSRQELSSIGYRGLFESLRFDSRSSAVGFTNLSFASLSFSSPFDRGPLPGFPKPGLSGGVPPSAIPIDNSNIAENLTRNNLL